MVNQTTVIEGRAWNLVLAGLFLGACDVLKEIFGLYLQGLILSLVTVLGLTLAWLAYRKQRQLDLTPEERQQVIYEGIIMCLMTTPIVAFAFMAILLMLKA